MINRVILVGNLGADPEIKYTFDGKPVVTFRIATNEVIIRNGEKEVFTEWHRIVAFGKLAEICGEYLSKGDLVYVEGRIKTREWETKEGEKRVTTEIYTDIIKFLKTTKKKKIDEININENQFNEEDIPF